MEVLVKPSRPVNLNLARMKFPPMAIISIMHRISGVFLFLLLPLALYMLHASLHSQESFDQLRESLATPVMSAMVWVLLSAVTFHFLAGLRHMLMDCGLGEHLNAAKITAYLIMLLEVIAMVLIGVWLW